MFRLKIKYQRSIFVICALCIISGISAAKVDHPNLLLTAKGVKEIRSSLGKYPLFDKSFAEFTHIADDALNNVINVPIPKDEGGGYTHEVHKQNYYKMQAAGLLYQIKKDEKYALFVKNMLYEYATMYPSLTLHPSRKSETPGKIFWQALNESVWLIHTAMAYDCVYNYLQADERELLESNLFYPMCEFLSNGNPANYAVFNKMHNHGTWATAAVGMIAYVMGNDDLVQKALYGSNIDGKTGFIKQLDVLFSPDGYFTEGPYYLRYAIWPFMMFAQVIDNRNPELKIFEYRDGVLLKALDILIQSSYQGELFYLNDALTKTFKTQEIVYAVNIAYKQNPKNLSLLNIMSQQGDFIITDAGITSAKSFYKHKNHPLYSYNSLLMRDGQNGTEGGIAILRNDHTPDATCMTFKATSHGLSHGHYDKLSITLHDNGNPVLTDYGAVRFLNIEPKYGGHYTKENYSWAMQTIAHNTVTINEESHYNAMIKTSSLYHPKVMYTDFSDPKIQVVSAVDSTAYQHTRMQRTVAMINDADIKYPLIVDVFKLEADQKNATVDLPFYYDGHMVSTDFPYQKQTHSLQPLGSKNGYQHIWLEASGATDKDNACFTWVNGSRFYSVTTQSNQNTEFLMTRLGANDPYFNLRPITAFMIRQKDIQNHTFISVIEPHGSYDISKEVTEGYKTNIESIKTIEDNEQFTAVEINTTNNITIVLAVMNKKANENAEYSFTYRGNQISILDNYHFSIYKK